MARLVFGFLPQVLIAKKLGLGYATDAYLMAISMNQIIVKFFRIGTLPKIFLMVLSEDFVSSKKRTNEHISNFLNVLFIMSLFVMIITFFVAPLLVNFIAKGFDLDKRLLTINIFRVLIPLFLYQFIISLFESVFKLNNEFSKWAVLSVVPPFVIAGFVFLFLKRYGIYSAVYGTLAGSFVHLLLLAYFIYFRFNYTYTFILKFKHGHFKKIFRLLSPYYISSVPVQIMLGVQSFLVSLLPTGFASVFFYARRIVDYVEQFSLNIFSQMMLPFFTKRIAQSSVQHLRKIYNQLVYLTNYTHLPLLIMLAIFGRQIVEIFFASRFSSPEIISALGITFSCFMLFYLPEPSNDIQTNIILAMKSTLLFNLINISRVVVTILLSLVLFKYFMFWGIVFSYSLTNLQGFLISQWFLRKRYGFDNIFIKGKFWNIIFLNLVLAVFCLLMNHIFSNNFPSPGLYQKSAIIAAICLSGVLVYIAISRIFKSEELKVLLGLLKAEKVASAA